MLRCSVGCGEVRGHGLAKHNGVGSSRSITQRTCYRHPVQGTYLALPRHADGRAILVTGGAINDLLSLPDVEAVAHCLAVQLTLPVALYYQKKKKASFCFQYSLLR